MKRSAPRATTCQPASKPPMAYSNTTQRNTQVSSWRAYHELSTQLSRRGHYDDGTDRVEEWLLKRSSASEALLTKSCRDLDSSSSGISLLANASCETIKHECKSGRRANTWAPVILDFHQINNLHTHTHTQAAETLTKCTVTLQANRGDREWATDVRLKIDVKSK